jgi:hypothetical protein
MLAAPAAAQVAANVLFRSPSDHPTVVGAKVAVPLTFSGVPVSGRAPGLDSSALMLNATPATGLPPAVALIVMEGAALKTMLCGLPVIVAPAATTLRLYVPAVEPLITRACVPPAARVPLFGVTVTPDGGVIDQGSDVLPVFCNCPAALVPTVPVSSAVNVRAADGRGIPAYRSAPVATL